MREDFTASVQYNDFKGTVAADGHDSFNLSSYLEKQGLLTKAHRIVATSVHSGNDFGNDLSVKTVGVNVYVVAGDVTDEALKAALENHDSSVMKKIEVSMSPAQFFALFKRFELCMSKHSVINGLPLYYEDLHEEEA